MKACPHIERLEELLSRIEARPYGGAVNLASDVVALAREARAELDKVRNTRSSGWQGVPDELRELSEKATRGPWRAHPADYPNKPVIRLDWRDGGGGVFTEVATVNAGLAEAKHNAAFVAAAVGFVRELIAKPLPSSPSGAK